MAVIELGWSADQFWHSPWHDFHAAMEYLADKRQREADAMRGSVGYSASGERTMKQVKVKGRPAMSLGGDSVKPGSPFQQYPGQWQQVEDEAGFARFRDGIIARFGTQIRMPVNGA